MSSIATNTDADRLLAALAEQIAVVDDRYELVVIGGSALLALGLIERATRDVDLVALRSDGALRSARPLPQSLQEARDRVARDFSLPSDWLNCGPTDLLGLGLPEGFRERLERRDYGPALTVYFASRYDQIHLKLYALVDQGPGKHEEDLRNLKPSAEELRRAAAWARSHDPSPAFAAILDQVLVHLEAPDGHHRP